MKRHIILLAAVFAAALLATGCEPEEINGPKNEGLTISLFSDEPETKAFDPTFESVIDHFDFFFFEDEAGTQPIAGMHGRATGSSTTLATGKNDTYAALRKRASYVYILANYPGTIDHTNDMALYELLALPVDHKIVTAKATEINPINGDVEETGEVTFNANLVMDSYHKDGTTEKHTVKIDAPRSVNEARTVTVGLTRLAAKLVLKINVAHEVDGSMSGEKWTPVLNAMKAYYVNALNNKTKVDGLPIQRSAIPSAQQGNYEYMTYPTPYPIAESTEDPYSYTSDPAFTYPQTWKPDENGDPYFKIQMVWSSNFRGTSNFYYKVRVPHTATGGFCTLERNTFYTVTVNLAVVDTENDYVDVSGTYVVEPWAESGWTGGNSLSVARFFNVPQTEYELYSNDPLDIPYYSSSAVSPYFTEISYNYYGNTNGTIYQYDFRYTKDDNNFDFTLPTTDSDGQSVVDAAKDPNQYTAALNGKFVRFTHSLNNIYTERRVKLVIENLEGEKETVTIIQHPAIEVKTHPTKNGFVNGRFARATADVKDGDGNLIGAGPYTATHFGGGQFYHSSQYWTLGNGTSSNGVTDSYGPRIGNNAAQADDLGIIYGDCTTGVNANTMFITEVTVGAFSEGSDFYTIKYEGESTARQPKYIIGDPRGAAPSSFSNLPNYLYSDRVHRDPNTGEATTGTDEFRAWEKPLEILIASQSADMNQVIAPRFLVSSNMNNMSQWSLSNANAVRRAATYQEAGYPAGRWRLPTEAEIAFMMAMQNKGVIAQLYHNTSNYQCANGRRIVASPQVTSNSSGNGYIRFVYDLWYWGDEPMDPNVYHPNMHEHTND